MQFGDRSQPVALVFDSSLGDSFGHVLALATLAALDARRELRLAGLGISRNDVETAAFSELLVRFYRGEQPGAESGRGAVTIGMFDGGAAERPSPMVSGVVGRTSGSAPLYPREIRRLNDTADPVAVLRNALTAQQDQSAIVVVAGPPVNLLGLLALPEGHDLVRNKVKTLVIASEAGDRSTLDALVGPWPSPIVHAGEDLELRYPAAAIDEDFTWAPNHPLVDAWRSAGGTADVPAQAAAAVLDAARPDDGYLGRSDPAGGYQNLTASADQRSRATQIIRELVSAVPQEPRRGRGGPF